MIQYTNACVTLLCSTLLACVFLFTPHKSYLAASLEAAYSFAKRGDGQGTTVWGRSIFGNLTNSLVPAPGAGGSAAAAAKSSTQATSGAPRRFPYRLVVKCRVLTGEGAEVI